jgi:hypothetical protein
LALVELKMVVLAAHHSSYQLLLWQDMVVEMQVPDKILRDQMLTDMVADIWVTVVVLVVMLLATLVVVVLADIRVLVVIKETCRRLTAVAQQVVDTILVHTELELVVV